MISLTLSACAVGPRYAPPDTPTPAKGQFVSTGSAGADQPLPPLWWRLYRDPVLDRLVRQALSENQTLKVAAANLAYAQALLDEARAGRYPSTSLTAGPQYGRSSTSLLTAAPAAWAYTAGFTASYQVDLFGRIRRTIEQASANVEATRAAEDVARVTVAAATAGAYANICGLGEQLDVANQSLEVVQQTYDITVRQRDAGGLSDFDVARQGVLLEQARATIAPLDGQRRSALFALAALIGKTPDEVPADAAGCRIPPRLGRPLPVGDGAALLRRRPDVRQAERTVAADTAGVGVAVANLYPTVTLGGSVSTAAGQLGQMFSYPSTSYGVGPLISWTFPNISVSLAQIAQARAQTSAAIATFDGTVLQALQETEQALATLATELDHNRALAAARTNADEALRLAQIQYQAGTASGLDQLAAEQTKIAADQSLAASDQSIAADQVAVFQALGGGWEDAPPVRGAEGRAVVAHGGSELMNLPCVTDMPTLHFLMHRENQVLTAFLDDVVDHGLISPLRLSERLNMPLSRLASVAGLHRNTLAHAESPRVQDRLGVIAKIIAKAAALGGDPGRAVIWFRYQPIAGFDNQTAEDLVAAGHGDAVLNHLEDLADGAYA